MRYEPIGYMYEYEMGALLVFLVIMLRYFTARRFPNQRNRLYSLILWATVTDVVLDVVSSLIIDNVFCVPLFITYLVNTLFYAMNLTMLVLMMVYTYALAGHIGKERFRRIIPLLIPGIFAVLLLFINPFTHWSFYVDPIRGYIHGAMFGANYAVCFVYLVITFTIAYRNRKALRGEEYNTIVLFLTVVLGSTVAQYFVPALLVTGVAMVLAVVLMYFTIQKPDSMMDTTTQTFTYDAMLSFLNDRMNERDHVQLVAIKVHNMSRINDLLGIENGSLLLKQVGDCMREGSDDVWVFRMRGSCFVAITRNMRDYAVLCERFVQRAGQIWKIGNTEVLLQATICCFATEEMFDHPISPEDAVNYIDTAFSHKELLKERIRVISSGAELVKEDERRKAVEAALRSALVTDCGLELHFQPIWSVKKGRFASAEVLLRFTHPTLGRVSPDEFVPIAENCGLVTELDEWVVRKACELIEKNHYDEFGIERIEINLSALEFMHRSLPELINDIMAHYSVAPSFLCFEITETAATESFEVLRDCMQRICNLGCEFALDDFGTGYANISQVLQLPFSIIKLDKTLLYHSGDVLEDMARMFSRMNCSVVVEGVETQQQAELCISCKVDNIQGYFYARPMNTNDFCAFLRKEQSKSAEA